LLPNIAQLAISVLGSGQSSGSACQISWGLMAAFEFCVSSLCACREWLQSALSVKMCMAQHMSLSALSRRWPVCRMQRSSVTRPPVRSSRSIFIEWMTSVRDKAAAWSKNGSECFDEGPTLLRLFRQRTLQSRLRELALPIEVPVRSFPVLLIPQQLG
jgi:hypothetical protein